MTSDPGSFARATIVERKPQIVGQVLGDNDYPAEIVAELNAFRHELAGQPVKPLPGHAPEADLWNEALAAFPGNTWLELPWYLAEAYFYRRLLEILGYFQPGPWQGRDPFAPQKRIQERAAVTWLEGHWAELMGVETEVRFEALLHSCLWGNRADLSNHGVRAQVRGGLATHDEQEMLLVDHTRAVAELLSPGVSRVTFINDNDGFELLFDLALAEFLLSQKWVEETVFHLKERPLFVSDAMPQDVREILTLLEGHPLGQRLSKHQKGGRFVLRTHPFWTGCLMFRHMPPDLVADLAEADLVILKGDANYRRLLDDSHWPHTARMEDIVGYFPAPLLALRTLKSEIMVGLAPGEPEALSAQDPDWLINGKRGIIQLVEKNWVRPRRNHAWRDNECFGCQWAGQRKSPGPTAADVGDPSI
jgi:hypothetical protein